MNDELLFVDEDDDSAPSTGGFPAPSPWKIMVVDDDDGVHSSTRFALERVEVDGRPIEIIDVYSGDEARDYLLKHRDVALALVDVVMESDHAGLDFVQWVRETQKNKAIRLVLRTGQPGQAPERHVVVNYDIDDYKTKSELTAQKLFTLLHASLRSYRQIRALERSMHGLEMVIDSAVTLCRSADSATAFASGVLEQVTALLNLGSESVLCQTQGLAACAADSQLQIIAATGAYADLPGADPGASLPGEIQALLAESLGSRSTVFRGGHCVAYAAGREESVALIYFQASRSIADDERPLIEYFARNIGAAFCNWHNPAHYCPRCQAEL
jgi:CheY-like chemotaxis protein